MMNGLLQPMKVQKIDKFEYLLIGLERKIYKSEDNLTQRKKDESSINNQILPFKLFLECPIGKGNQLLQEQTMEHECRDKIERKS